MGFITHRPEEPYVNGTSTVLWELGASNRPWLPDDAPTDVPAKVGCRRDGAEGEGSPPYPEDEDPRGKRAAI